MALTDGEMNDLLEQFDETEPASRRGMVARLATRAAAAETRAAAADELVKSLESLVARGVCFCQHTKAMPHPRVCFVCGIRDLIAKARGE